MKNNNQNTSLLKNILNPVPKNRKFYKYLDREDCVDDQGSYWHKYSLKGILSIDYHLSDIYRLFFKSFYNATGERMLCKNNSEQNRSKIKQENISQFYKQFIRLIYLQSLLGRQSIKTDYTVDLVSEIVNQKQGDKDLSTITKRLVAEYNTYYRSYWQKNNSNFRSYKLIRELRAKIRQELINFYKYIQQNLTQITQIEMLPYPLSETSLLENAHQLLPHIQKAYQQLSNIYLLSRTKKQKMLQNMEMTLGRYISVKVNEAEKFNVYFSRLSKDKQAVLTMLQHYMVIRRVSNKTAQFSLKQANVALIGDILALCKKYYKLVSKFYPLIKAEDIIIDQKSLKPILGHTSLIYDALGIQNRQISSIQLQLAMNSTPKLIQFEKSYFEIKQDAEWPLIRKYFIERGENKQDQSEVKHKNEQIQSDDSDQQIEKEKSEGCPVKSWDIEQQSHVWRLICIFYQILNQKHLIQTFYNKRYQKLSDDCIPPFKKVLYEKALQQLHNQLNKNPQKLGQYLGLQLWSKQDNYSLNFDFRFRQLQKLLKLQLQNDDSLLQKHRFEKSKSELWVRGVLRKEIFDTILKEKYFKKMLNAKKYMLMLTILGMELSYESIYRCWQGEKKAEARKLLFSQLNDENEFKKFSFKEQRERQRNNFQSINKRLNQYLSRTDDQNKYLQINKEYKEYIKTIYDNITCILKNQKQIEDLEQKIGVDKSQQRPQARQIFKNLIAETKVRVVKTFNLSSKVLDEIVKNELENKLEKVEDFHKVERTSREFLIYITKRFYYMLKAYQTVMPFNFRKYQTFVLPFLLEPNLVGVHQKRVNNVQQPNEWQLVQMNARLNQIDQILKQHNKMQINESGVIEPKMAY